MSKKENNKSRIKVCEQQASFLFHYMGSCLKNGKNNQKVFNEDNYLFKYPDIKSDEITPVKHYLLHGIKEGRSDVYNIHDIIKNLNLFDLDYYCAQSGTSFDSYDKGLDDYIHNGYEKGYNPCTRFNGNIYLKKYPDVAEENQNPLIHYVRYGKKEGRTCRCNKNIRAFKAVEDSGLFDYDYYMTTSGIAERSPRRALLHYLEIGYTRGFNPSEDFNSNDYLKKYPDVEENGWNPLVHYVKYGIREERTCTIDNNIREYKVVEESELFDENYYMNECGIEFTSRRNAVFHYLEIGYDKGFNPSTYFDGNTYLERYPDIAESNLNPLIHYLKFGFREGRFGLKEHEYKNFNESYDVNNIIEQLNKDVLVLIRTDNIELAKKCVDNIEEKSKNTSIVLFSKKDITPEDISYLGKYNNIEIYKNVNTHKGFITSLNKIIRENNSDIILLKDNIRVFDNWTQKLVTAAYSSDRIGFVSPISNYHPIELISMENSEKSARTINNMSNKDYNLSPPANDSCIFIKKDVFSQLEFNKETQEDTWIKDFYKQAKKQGWRSIFDDSTYVYYESTVKQNRQQDKYNLTEPYTYDNQADIDFVNSEAFRKTYENINTAGTQKSRRRILLSMHYGGGVEHTLHDITQSMSSEYTFYILKSNGKKLTLYKVIKNIFTPVHEFKLKYKWHAKMVHSDEFAQIYFYILANYNIDIVEIEHSIFHTFDLAKIAKLLGLKTVIAIHDFYYICPTYFLLDGDNKYCGGHCGNQIRNCGARTTWFDLPANIVEWRRQWQKYVSELFKNCDTIITATQFTKSMFLDQYAGLYHSDIVQIEHGRDLIRYDNLYTTPNRYQPIKILVPGTIGVHKGSEFIKQLKKVDKDNRLEFHFMGLVDEELREIGIYHGRYRREDFQKNVYKIKPSFIGIFSICAETYSHTLTEAIASGIPVIASNLGALKTRIEARGGGWLIDINSPEKTYRKILEISENKEEYKKVQKQIKDIKIVTKKEMSENYEKLYKRLLTE